MDKSRNAARYVDRAHRLRKRAVFALLAALMLCVPAAYADEIAYEYDESGRLVQASNFTSGEAVRYTYDPVGNITSQISGSLNALAVGHFTPSRGPAGSQITINGTGFSTTPANNVVRFNGTQATVVSSSQTKIVATVPASATSGPIGVEVAAASALSAQPFTVTATSDDLAITAVLPNVSAIGNIVTIVGSNFEPTPLQNRVRFNNAVAEVIASTATTITVRVPPEATPGKIRVTTPRGTAESPTDFLVLPPPYLNIRPESVARMANDGTGSNVTSTTFPNFAVRLFDGAAGDLLTIGLSNMTVTSAGVQVYAPDNTLLRAVTVSSTSPGLQLPKLTVTGTYSIFITPSPAGSLTVGVFKPIATALTLGSPTTVNLAPPGRRAALTFDVPANTYANVVLSGVTVSAGTFSLIAPGGVVLKSQALNTTGLSIQPHLKQAGTYTLLLDPNGSIGGSATATVSTTAAPSLQRSNTLEFGLANATPTNLTFRGEIGEYLTILTDLDAPSAFALSIVVRAPDGAQLIQRAVGTSFNSGGRSRGAGIVHVGPLPMGGTYTATLTRTGGSSSTVKVTLTGALATSGSSATVVAGQSVMYSFHASAGQFASVAIAQRAGFMRGATATLLRPDGLALTSRTFEMQLSNGGVIGAGNDSFRHGTAVIGSGPLPLTGTYRVLVQLSDRAREQDTYGGAWEFTASEAQSRVISVNGGGDVADIEVNGQGLVYRFAANAGDHLSVGLASDQGEINLVAATILDPNGVPVAEGGMTAAYIGGGGPGIVVRYGSGVVNTPQPLQISGTYTLFVQQVSGGIESVGNIHVTLSRPFAAGLQPNTPVVDVPIARAGQGVFATFSGAPGQYRTIRVATSGWITAAAMKVLAPDGSELRAVNITTTLIGGGSTLPQGYTGHNLISVGPFTVAGTYSVLIQQTGAGQLNTGAFSLQLSSPVGGSMPATSSAVEVTMGIAGQGLRYTFSANAGDYRALVVSETSGPIRGAEVSIIDANSSVVVSTNFNANCTTSNGNAFCTGRMLMNAGPLPATGTYAVVVKQTTYEPNNVEAKLTLTLSAPVASPLPAIDIPLIGQGVRRTFTGAPGQLVSVQVEETNSGISGATVKILAPNGALLNNGTLTATGCSSCGTMSGSVTLTSGQLPVDGTYSVLVQQTSLSSTGIGQLTVNVANLAGGSGGTSNISTTTPGQIAVTPFIAAAGQSFGVAFTSVAVTPSSTYIVDVLRPDGTTAVATTCAAADPGCAVAVRDARAGTHQIRVRPASNATITGVLSIAPALTQALDIGTPLAINTNIGQPALLSFATTTRQTLALSVGALSTTPANTQILLLVVNSAGASRGTFITKTANTVNLVDLPADAYFVWITPQFPMSGAMTLSLRPMVGGSVPADGSATNVVTTSPLQNAYYTFEAQAGESVSVSMTGVVLTPATPANYRIQVSKPDGTSENLENCSGTSCVNVMHGLVQTGTYVIVISPQVEASLSGTLTVAKAVTATLVPDVPLSLTLDRIGQPALLSFTAIADQYFSLNVGALSTLPAGTQVEFAVRNSKSATVASARHAIGMSIDLPRLAPGVYTVWVEPLAAATSTMQVTLKSTATVTPNGSTTNFTVPPYFESAYFTFYAEAGQSVGVAISDVTTVPASTGTSHQLEVTPPVGTTTSLNCSAPRCRHVFRDLKYTGTYRVAVRPTNAFTISGTLTVSTAVTGTLVPDAPFALNLNRIGQPALLSFTAAQGQHFSLNMGGLSTSPATTDVTVEVLDSTSNREGIGRTTASQPQGLSIGLPNLSADTYFVWITGADFPMTASAEVVLRSTPMVAASGTATNFAIPALWQSAYFTFNAQAGDSIAVTLTDMVTTPLQSGTTHRIGVDRPDGTNITSLNCQPPSCILTLPIGSVTLSGAYRLTIAPAAAVTLTANVRVATAVVGALTPGTPLPVNLSAVGQGALLSFSLPATQTVTMNIGAIVSSPAGTSYTARIYNAANGIVVSGSSTSAITLNAANVPAGNYRLWITPATPATGTMTVSY